MPIRRRVCPRVHIEEAIAENPPPVYVCSFGPQIAADAQSWLAKLLGPIWSTAPLAVCALEFLWRNERDRGENVNEYSNRGSVFCALVKQKTPDGTHLKNRAVHTEIHFAACERRRDVT